MSTQPSDSRHGVRDERFARKRILVVGVGALAALLVIAVVAPLLALAAWVERDLRAFPFRDEDWLRYLLPNRFEPSSRPRLMLAGPSTVRENFRYELFERAFPGYDVYHGGISQATLEDVTAGLEYIEKAYGEHALPDVIVLGLSLRVVAGIPTVRPFAPALTRYSPYYSAVQERTRIVLQPKSTVTGLLARARFFVSKQPARFRTAVLAALNYALLPSTDDPVSAHALVRASDRLLTSPAGTRVATMLGRPEMPRVGTAEVLHHLTQPYRYSLWPSIPMEQYLNAESYNPAEDETWAPIYSWDAQRFGDDARARLRDFVAFVTRHAIPTLVINMPERAVSRAFYDRANYDVYLRLLQSELQGIELVDVWEYLDTADFFDREHTTTAGSIRLTREIIRLARETVLRPVQAADRH